MEYGCDIAASRASHPRFAEAQQEFRMIEQMSAHALTDLPAHRSLVEQMIRRG